MYDRLSRLCKSKIYPPILLGPRKYSKERVGHHELANEGKSSNHIVDIQYHQIFPCQKKKPATSASNGAKRHQSCPTLCMYGLHTCKIQVDK